MFTLFYLLSISMLISMLLILINFTIQKKKINDREKITPFECGFDPLSSPRLPFSIQFYLIGMIFLIFDVEIILFLPMTTSFFSLNFFMWFKISSYFIVILLMGLYIEWNDGALKWFN